MPGDDDVSGGYVVRRAAGSLGVAREVVSAELELPGEKPRATEAPLPPAEAARGTPPDRAPSPTAGARAHSTPPDTQANAAPPKAQGNAALPEAQANAAPPAAQGNAAPPEARAAFTASFPGPGAAWERPLWAGVPYPGGGWAALPSAPGGGPRAENFVAQARRWAARTQEWAEPAAFLRYYPTYDYLNAAQERWYFCWRTRFRNGDAAATDTSYLFLLAYELVNLVGPGGELSPAAARDDLMRLWRAYRQQDAVLDAYLPFWARDMALAHSLGDVDAPLGELLDAGQVPPRSLADLLPVLAARPMERWPLAALTGLAGHKARAATPGGVAATHVSMASALEAARQAAADLDVSLRAAGRGGLLDMFAPQETPRAPRAPFPGALYCGPIASVQDPPRRDYLGQAPLRAALNGLIRRAEAHARAVNGGAFRRPDAGGLDAASLAVVDAALTRVLGAAPEPSSRRVRTTAARRAELAAPPEASAPPVVRVNLARARRLAAASQVTAALLAGALAGVGMAGESAPPAAPDTTQPPAPIPPASGAPGAPEAAFLGRLNPLERAVLGVLVGGERVTERVGALAREAGTLPSLPLDAINLAADDCLRDVVWETVDEEPRLIEDWRDPLTRLLEGAPS